MSSVGPTRTAGHRARSLAIGVLVVLVVGMALVAAFGHGSPAARSVMSSPRSLAGPTSSRVAPPLDAHASELHLPARPSTDHAPAVGRAAGVVSGDVSIFDDQVPAVTRLDPALLAALRRAATDAADDGVLFYVNSGWRSAAYQEQLLQAAISKYGSVEDASRWVASPDRSEHVSGDAVDIGHHDAAAWLARHGARYGLCQIYRNEPWHFELRPDAVTQRCPDLYADPTQDPRMHP